MGRPWRYTAENFRFTRKYVFTNLFRIFAFEGPAVAIIGCEMSIYAEIYCIFPNLWITSEFFTNILISNWRADCDGNLLWNFYLRKNKSYYYELTWNAYLNLHCLQAMELIFQHFKIKNSTITLLHGNFKFDFQYPVDFELTGFNCNWKISRSKRRVLKKVLLIIQRVDICFESLWIWLNHYIFIIINLLFWTLIDH